MKKVIYITSNYIVFVRSKLRGDNLDILDLEYIPLEDGTFINGVVLNTSNFLDSLLLLKKKVGKLIQKSELVIDSSSIITKKIDVPTKVNKQMLLSMPKMELAHATEIYSDVIYDIELFKEGNEQKALCCAVEEKITTVINELFLDVGITLCKIDIALIRYINFALYSKKIDRTNGYLLNVIDGDVLYSLIFVNNSFVFSSRTRFFEDVGSESFYNGQKSNISGLQQFQNSVSTDNPIKNVYYYGLSSDVFDTLSTYCVDLGVKLNLVKYSKHCNKSVDSNLKSLNLWLPLFSFYPVKIGYNLLSSSTTSVDFELLRKQKRKFFLYPLFCILILSVVLCFSLFRLITLEGTRNDLQTILNSTSYNTEYLSGIESTEILNTLNKKEYLLDLIESDINDGSLELMHILTVLSNTPITVTILSIDYTKSESTILLDCTAIGETEASKYVSVLRKTFGLDSVHYTARSSGTLDTYNFTVGILTSFEGVSDYE